MPAYSFEAIDASGQSREGVLEADTARSARSLLRAQALIPLSVKPVGSDHVNGTGQRSTLSRWLGGGKRVFSSTGLAVWTRQLAGLVSSGLPLERALTALTDEAESEQQRNLVASLRAEVNAGSPFARALSAASARVLAHLHGRDRRRRTERQPRPRARPPRRRPRRTPGAAAEADRRGAVPGHRHAGGDRDRDLPRELRGAAGGAGLCGHQALAALPHHRDAVAERGRAQLWLVDAVRRRARGRWRAGGAGPGGLPPEVRRRSGSSCRWSESSRAATTQRASRARSPCWPRQACRSCVRCRRLPRR